MREGDEESAAEEEGEGPSPDSPQNRLERCSMTGSLKVRSGSSTHI